jgi:Rhs element Vgr protein
MADSPSKLSSGILSMDILINGKEINNTYEIMSIEVNRQVNKIASAYFSLHLTPEESEGKTFKISESDEFLPGNKVEIKAGYNQKNEPIFKGIIISQGLEVEGANKIRLEVYCKDEAIKMTSSLSNEYFKEKKDAEIMAALAKKHGLEVDVQSTGYKHPLLVQYQATNWDFMLTRAQANGFIVNTQDGKLYIEAPKSKGNPELSLKCQEDVFEFRGAYDVEQQPASVSAYAWNRDTQAVIEGKAVEPEIVQPGNFQLKQIASKIGHTPSSIRTDGHLASSQLKEWANARLTHSRLALFKGRVSFFGNAKPQLNSILELSGFGKRFNGNILVTEVNHRIKEGNWQTTVRFGVEQEWFYEKVNSIAPLAGGLLPPIQGIHIGIVKKIEKDEENAFRVLVKIPGINNEKEEIWARITQPYAGEGHGFFFYPETNDEVAVGFINNDPRYAVILGSLYNKKSPPSYTPERENPIKAITSKSKIKIEFDDKNKDLLLETPGGHTILLSDKSREIDIQDSNGNKMSLSKSGIDINSVKDITIKAKGKLTLSANRKIAVKTIFGDVTLDGINVKARAKMGFQGSGMQSAKVSSNGQLVIKGATVMIN